MGGFKTATPVVLHGNQRAVLDEACGWSKTRRYYFFIFYKIL